MGTCRTCNYLDTGIRKDGDSHFAHLYKYGCAQSHTGFTKFIQSDDELMKIGCGKWHATSGEKARNKDKVQEYTEGLEKKYSRWKEIYTYGSDDPNWSDGMNLNAIRRHIIDFKQQIESMFADEDYPESYFWPNPVEKNNDFMVNPNIILAEAKTVLHNYKNHLDYRWLIEHKAELREGDKGRDYIDTVLGHVARLEMAFVKNDIVYLRRHVKTDAYLSSLSVCRATVEKYLNEHKAKEEFQNKSILSKFNDEQIPGQISFRELLIG